MRRSAVGQARQLLKRSNHKSFLLPQPLVAPSHPSSPLRFLSSTSVLDSPAPDSSSSSMAPPVSAGSINPKLEETLVKEGYEEGYNQGLTVGIEEGRQVGLETGFEVGEELGFYQGCVNVWKSAIKIDPTQFSVRVQKNIQHIGDLLDKYPIMELENEDAQEIMNALRRKFRLVRAALGVKLEYDGYPKSKDLEF